ncbi:MAG: ATPase, partial [Fimbriimonadales bacterium]
PVVVTSFGILGGIIALTGFMQTSYAGASTSSVGDLMELDAIAACVIGGTSLKGGRGTVVGTLMGAALMSILLNGMTLLAVNPEIKFVVRGTVLVVAVVMDVSTRRQRF